MTRHFTVLGATGNVGTQLTHHLLAAGHRVTAVARASDRLDALAQGGATPAAIDLTDTARLTAALRGADGAFLMIPSYWAAPDVLAFSYTVGRSIRDAVVASGLPYAVNLSSMGAELPAGTGPIQGLRALEQHLDAITGLHVVHLRAAYFMENLLADLPLMRQAGITGGLLRPELTFPLVATRDIAAHAAELLLAGTATGVRQLVGPRAHAPAEITALVGQAIGLPTLPYVPFSHEQLRNGLRQGGLSESMITEFTELLDGMNAERFLVHPDPTLVHRLPTPLETFVREVVAPAYRTAAQSIA